MKTLTVDWCIIRWLEHEIQEPTVVTESYLRAWCDPTTPNGAFVWVVSKKDRTITRKSPKSLFSENDFYTYYDSKNNRFLELEHKLQEVEAKFIQLRDKKLIQHVPLTENDKLIIALFASSTFARTKRWKEDGQKIWQEYIKMVDNLPQDIEMKVKASQDYKDVINIHRDQPMIFHLFLFTNVTAPYLYEMSCAIYETKSEPGFITSDNPCFWFDPAIYNPNLSITYFGIGSPTLNIILPISPQQYISLEKNGADGYINLSTRPEEIMIVNGVNNLIAMNCNELIVVNSKTFKEKWFEGV